MTSLVLQFGFILFVDLKKKHCFSDVDFTFYNYLCGKDLKPTLVTVTIVGIFYLFIYFFNSNLLKTYIMAIPILIPLSIVEIVSGSQWHNKICKVIGTYFEIVTRFACP